MLTGEIKERPLHVKYIKLTAILQIIDIYQVNFEWFKWP